MLSASCGIATDPDERLEIAQSALEDDNALNPNALNPNALNPNALNPNALAWTALDFPALVPGAKSALQNATEAGVLSRELLKYVVSCAFTSEQSFVFSWLGDAGELHVETYPGLLGLASAWSYRQPSTAEQQWVSACIASRVNLYGVSVTISSRASHTALNKVGTTEMVTYTVEEGAFWGNLFGAPGALFACYNEANREHARMLSRACAAGHEGSSGIESCGMIEIVGSCDAHCDEFQPIGLYRSSCDGSGKVISTFLP
jgi:hypothetical protein